jgi:ABC-type polysaccharide/polyol phosphate transport system ATPase subunit
LGERSFRYKTLRATLTAPRRTSGDERQEIWALRQLDLEVDEGDVVGIVGRNGAEKTTS